MYSSEPFEPSVNPVPPIPTTPAAESEEWRADIASRVQSYRARQKNHIAEQQSLGFPPQHAEGADSPNSKAVPTRTAASPGESLSQLANSRRAGDPSADTSTERLLRRKTTESTPGAFDTNYYRRQNALAKEQSAPAIAAAIVPEDGVPGPGVGLLGRDFAEQELEVVALGEKAPEPTLDLELHAPAAGDACLERYRLRPSTPATGAPGTPMHGPEPVGCATTAAAQTADPRHEEIGTPLLPAVARSGSSAPAQAPAVHAAPPPAAYAVHGNLLVFPRPLVEPPLWAQPSRDELADPVSRPRILDVPEEIMPTVQGSLFPEIRLDVEEPEASARREPALEIPLPVAPLSARLKAGLADLSVVASGGGLFAAIAGRAMPELSGKPWAALIAMATMVLWAAYQQMFLLYAGRTVGMRMAGIRLSTFDGRTPQWNERRSRARYVLISCASVALGFLWALLDEDTLCWHDRVSQTFPTMN